MSDYARATGRSVRSQHLADAGARPPRALSAAEQARVAENRAFVLEHMPELAPLIKELHAAGFIPGWRSVENCELGSRETEK